MKTEHLIGMQFQSTTFNQKSNFFTRNRKKINSWVCVSRDAMTRIHRESNLKLTKTYTDYCR